MGKIIVKTRVVRRVKVRVTSSRPVRRTVRTSVRRR